MNLVATAPKSSMSSTTLSSEALGTDLPPSLAIDRLNPLRSSRPLQPILPVLRAQYPTGSLSADLVQVVQDQFIVQARVQVDGLAIVTALASASTIEVAEDRARARVLEALGLSNSAAVTAVSATPTALSTTVSLVPEIAPEITPEIAEVAQPDPLPSPTAKATKAGSRRKSKTAVVEPVSEPVIEFVNESIEPLVAIESEAPLLEIAAPEPVIEEEAEPIVAVEELPVEESFEVTFEGSDLEGSDLEGGDVEYEFSYEAEPDVTIAATAPIEAAPTPAVTPTPASMPDFGLDLSDAIAQIGSEIDRIGWTKKQGSAYLQETYGKRTRAELTEAELFAFLAYLKSLPAKVQPDLTALPF